MPGGGLAAPRGVRRLSMSARLWLLIFGGSLVGLLVRFLVPTPVGQADNHDGHRLMCRLGVRAVVPHGYARFYSYAYFEYGPIHGVPRCPPYPSSQLVLLELARLLTPAFGLPGTLNLIALGVLSCLIISFGIASLAVGLRLKPWAQLIMAAGVWLIMADATFFDVLASPFAEPAALLGMLLVAAGVVYLGRGRRANLFGLVLTGSGGLLAALSKEQYLILAVPVCLALLVVGVARSGGRGFARLWMAHAGAAVTVAALVGLLTAGYWFWDGTNRYAAQLHHESAIDMIFRDIVNGHDNARADLRALGLPASWAKYAGGDTWSHPSPRHDRLYHRYEAKLTESNIARFLLTHPGRIISVGQRAAAFAQQFRVTYLGNYQPRTGHPPRALESRVALVTWLMRRLPPGLGLLWLIPLWAFMAAVAITTLFLRRGDTWHRDGAVLVLCMTGCAIAAFIPAAYFAGITITRHMTGMNLATALAFPVSIALAASIACQLPAPRWRRRASRPERPAGLPAPAGPEGADSGT